MYVYLYINEGHIYLRLYNIYTYTHAIHHHGIFDSKYSEFLFCPKGSAEWNDAMQGRLHSKGAVIEINRFENATFYKLKILVLNDLRK